VRGEHIKDLLDRLGLASLGGEELAAVRSHAEGCGECARAYEAARVSASLLEARASEVFEPPPFFQTRVLAALRERQAAGEAWSFGRLWKAAGLLVSSMAATVAVLATLTFVVPQQTATPQVATASDTYTAEDVIFDQAAANGGQVSDEQVLATLYGADEGAEK
jgi:anti-sigma-K factor RskA